MQFTNHQSWTMINLSTIIMKLKYQPHQSLPIISTHDQPHLNPWSPQPPSVATLQAASPRAFPRGRSSAPLRWSCWARDPPSWSSAAWRGPLQGPRRLPTAAGCGNGSVLGSTNRSWGKWTAGNVQLVEPVVALYPCWIGHTWFAIDIAAKSCPPNSCVVVLMERWNGPLCKGNKRVTLPGLSLLALQLHRSQVVRKEHVNWTSRNHRNQ